MTKPCSFVVVMVVACTGVEAPDEEPEDLDLIVDGKGDVDVAAFRNGGDLWINSCRPGGDATTLVCAPFRMRIAPGGATTTTKLPEVTQPITHARSQPGLIALPGLVGSTVDRVNRRVFWHADCDGGYHVTDIDTGVTTTFAIDRAALGIPTDTRGFCLNEWAFDERRQVAVAIAGQQDRTGGTVNEKSSLEYVLALDGEGGVRLLHDLRGRLDPRLRFLHEFQTIASLDPDRDELVAPVVRPDSGVEDQVLVNIATGAASLIGQGGARVHRFFDVAARRQTALDCSINGFTNALVGPSTPRVQLSLQELTVLGINACIPGFTGGAYDPVGTKELLLLRAQQITPAGVFFLGVADMTTNRWLGIGATDARYDQLGMSAVTASQRLFLSTEFIPATTGGTSITIGDGRERLFQTAVVAPGTYVFVTTGIGDVDLYVRRGLAPTTEVFDCRSQRFDANETCSVTLPAADRIRVMVRGIRETSTFRITARAQ
jgi:hypothetical protein